MHTFNTLCTTIQILLDTSSLRLLLWTMFVTLDNVCYFGQCALLWTMCFTLDNVLYFGQCALLWTMCFTLDNVLYVGQCALLWTMLYEPLCWHVCLLWTM